MAATVPPLVSCCMRFELVELDIENVKHAASRSLSACCRILRGRRGVGLRTDFALCRRAIELFLFRFFARRIVCIPLST